MKKAVIIVSAILLILIAICIVGIKVNSKTTQVIKNENKEYENYLNKEIYGTDVISLINKAVNSNDTKLVKKDEKNFYINNNVDSIQIDIEFITDEEKNETTTYKMEQISNLGTIEFIKNFNTAKFKCISKSYHEQTGKISYIKLLQQAE